MVKSTPRAALAFGNGAIYFWRKRQNIMPRDWKGGNASTFKTIGASNHCEHERADKDYYATEPRATELLCEIERFEGPILEPSCGEGHISRVLTAKGLRTITSSALIYSCRSA